MKWLRVEPIRASRKTVAVISGSSRTQALWWRKKTSGGQTSNRLDNSKSSEMRSEGSDDTSLAVDAKNALDMPDASKPTSINLKTDLKRGSSVVVVGPENAIRFKENISSQLEEVVVSLALKHSSDSINKGGVQSITLEFHALNPMQVGSYSLTDCTNKVDNSSLSAPTRKWTKLVRYPAKTNPSSDNMIDARRMDIKLADTTEGKT